VKRQEISLPWADADPPDAKQRCLSLNIKDSKFALDYVECKAEIYAVCEVKPIEKGQRLIYMKYKPNAVKSK
jgi:hypothetical protein